MTGSNPPSALRYDPELPTTQAQELHAKLERRTGRRRAFWNGHLSGYIAINAFLAFIDLITGGGLWFPYVAGAMAIPLLPHYIQQRRRERLKQKLEYEIARDPSFPDRMFRPFRKLHRSVTHFMMGAGSAAVISGYLFLVNAMTGGSFWSIIPAASLALPVVFHGLILRGRRRTLLEIVDAGGDNLDEREANSRRARRRAGRRLEAAIDRGETRKYEAPPDPEAHPMLQEARRLEREIAGRLPGAGTAQMDLEGSVKDLVSEIARLCGLSAEFTTALRQIPLPELEADRSALVKRRSDATDESLEHHYGTALEQVERQIASVKGLESRKELLDLRIRTGVNSLRQINVDLVRMQGDAALGTISKVVQERTEELSAYINDLQRSYDELRDDLGEYR